MRRYLCYAAPCALHDAFARATSAGRVFDDRVRGRFRYEGDPARKRHRPDQP